MLALVLAPFLLGTGVAIIFPWLQACGFFR